MEVVVNNETIEFSGLLNEESSIDTIKKGLEQAFANSKDKVVRLDFSKVKRANSCGILAWYKILDGFKNGTCVYFNVPRWLVEQFNISDFLSDNTLVESIQANFYCPSNDTHETLLLTIGKEIPVLDNYDNFSLVMQSKDGLDLEMDFEPNEYFYFISSNTKRFKGEAA
jgi:ABC-type transporter Mla MlaB component